MTPQERAEAHWNGYVGPLMEVMMKSMLDVCRFHYISSHVHGSKHGVEDEQERVCKEAFMDTVIDDAVAETLRTKTLADIKHDCPFYDSVTGCDGEPHFLRCSNCVVAKERAKCPK